MVKKLIYGFFSINLSSIYLILMFYINQLTFLRFIAAIIIVIFHYGSHLIIFNHSVFSNVIGYGPLAVGFFYFLSGTVLMVSYHKYERVRFGDFMLKRIARIYPVYLIALLFTLVLGMLIEDSYPMGISVIAQIFTIQAWVPSLSMGVNYPGWSISVEMFFYLSFPFLMNQFKKKSFLELLMWVLLIWLTSAVLNLLLNNTLPVVLSKDLKDFVFYFPLWHINTFIFGVLCGLYILKNTDNHGSLWKYRLMYTGGFLLLLYIVMGLKIELSLLHNGLLSPVFFMIIAGFSLDVSYITTILSNKKLIVLGNASFSAYILQYPVYLLFTYIYQNKTFTVSQFCIYLVFLIAISLLTYFFVEERARTLILKTKRVSSSVIAG